MKSKGAIIETNIAGPLGVPLTQGEKINEVLKSDDKTEKRARKYMEVDGFEQITAKKIRESV